MADHPLDEHCPALPLPHEMRAWDQAAVRDWRIPSLVLMENASRAFTAQTLDFLGRLPARAVVFCGPGNNGGDGLAVARLLAERGVKVLVGLAAPRGRFKGDAAFQLRLTTRLGLPVMPLHRLPEADLAYADLVVDALLGTGFAGELREDMRRHIERINAWRAHGGTRRTACVDIPSGLCGRTGQPGPTAVRADLTVSFEAAKPGLVLPEAAGYVGELRVASIGIPYAVKKALPPSFRLLGPDLFALVPRTSDLGHKATAGRVTVAGGSAGLLGAPVLSAKSALRGGAGMVTLVCPAPVESALRGLAPAEVMTRSLDHACWNASAAQDLFASLADQTVLALGPGLGRTPDATAFVQAVLDHPHFDRTPVVFDADALFALAAIPDGLSRLHADCVLTPHPLEAARLLGWELPQVMDARARALGELTGRTKAACLLKGAGSLVAQASQGSTVFVSPFATSVLAVGGSGDVLTGLAAAFLARACPPLVSLAAAVYAHGLCATEVSKRFPAAGALASETADALPQTLGVLACSRHPTS